MDFKQEIEYLNLYACVGGNRKNLPPWVKVTAVENDPKIAAVYQKMYPLDTVVIADAHQYLLSNYRRFGFIWSSPPCPTHGKFALFTRNELNRYPDMSLYQEVIFLKHFCKVPWVVENVKPYYQLLIPAKEVGRHLFWANFRIGTPGSIYEPVSIMKEFNGVAGRKKAMDWLGIYFEEVLYCDGNHDPCQVLRNCVHPELGLYIFNCAMGIEKKKKQGNLFFD